MRTCTETLTAGWRALAHQALHEDTYPILLIIAVFLLILVRLQQLGGVMRFLGMALSSFTVVVLTICTILAVTANSGEIRSYGSEVATTCFSHLTISSSGSQLTKPGKSENPMQ